MEISICYGVWSFMVLDIQEVNYSPMLVHRAPKQRKVRRESEREEYRA